MLNLTSNAQGRITPQERLKNLQQKLNLTEEQSTNVEKILVDSDKQIQKLRESDNPDRAEFRKIMDNSNEQIMQVLNEKQKTEFNKILEQRKNRRQGNSKNKNH
jgi:periplasmic protein CpxP/Spy